MLATFIIGLREGLEAALIVGIIAAFLTRNGRRLTPMWLGVGAAILLSLGVGITLAAVEHSLPQTAQEAMESVIGAVAVFFVTGMILWMSSHSRGLKRELESSARNALSNGASSALVVMAFLAVLREGFETAVFLLATFQAATSSVAAAVGALLGILVSIGLGIGIYRGGVRLDLSKFFRATGVFLVLVAGGLVVTSLRTAHAAGWLLAGQQRTFDLSWLAPVGSIRGALFTGVIGIPADPRLVEVVGWICYVVPMMLIVLWPPAKRPSVAAGVRLRRVLAVGLAAVAVLLAVIIRVPALTVPATAPLVDQAGGALGTARLTGPTTLQTTIGTTTTTTVLADQGAVQHAGTTAEHLAATSSDAAAGLPTRITLDELVALAGGRVPVGVDVQRNPGPYTASWTGTSQLEAWTADGVLLDARSHGTLVLTLSGGGLSTARTLSISAGATLPGGAGTATTGWTVQPTYVDQVGQAVRAHDAAQIEVRFWGRIVPVVLLLAAAILLVIAHRRSRTLAPGPAVPVQTPPGDRGSAVVPGSVDTASVNTESVDTASVDTAAVDTASVDTAAVNTAPDNTSTRSNAHAG